jgi:hypothetical protein
VLFEVKTGFGRSSVSFFLIALQQTEALATAIGSSGNRSDAIAPLKSIVLDDGVRLPIVDVELGQFAADTPRGTMRSKRSADDRPAGWRGAVLRLGQLLFLTGSGRQKRSTR